MVTIGRQMAIRPTAGFSDIRLPMTSTSADASNPLLSPSSSAYTMSTRSSSPEVTNRLKVLSFNVWGLAIIAKDRASRIKAIADHLASSSYDIVCLQELWVYKDYEQVRDTVARALPHSRFFHTGALGSGLAIFTKAPHIFAQAMPYSLSGTPQQAFAGDFYVKKAAGFVVIDHPLLGELAIWTSHMHAAGEHAPDTRQSHRIAQSWQLANAVRQSAAAGRYILCMGDFNAQPYSIPIAILRTQGGLADSFQVAHPECEAPPGPGFTDEFAIFSNGKTCDSPLNTWSAGKNIPGNILEQGGKRLDYIMYRQPGAVRRRLANKESREETESATSDMPVLRCVSSEVVLTEHVPGEKFSYSDHFGLLSTFQIDSPKSALVNVDAESIGHQPSTATDITDTKEKEDVIRKASGILRDYSQISANSAQIHWYVVYGSIVLLLALTIGSAWQPKSWLQPIFTLVGGLAGMVGATCLYFAFVWGRWEQGLLNETIESMDLELQIMKQRRR